MPKYYVESGGLQVVIDRCEPRTAILDALRRIPEMTNPPEMLSIFIKAGEQGFGTLEPEDRLFLTEEVLQEAGVSHFFSCEEDVDSTWQ